jgi:predicted SAM-dependent methyltransferase
MKNEYVHYGCGFCAPDSWRNFDASPTLRFERLPVLGRLYTKNDRRFPANVEYGDIIRGLPVRSESCRAVYCSHVLEHLALEDFRSALRNTYRMLRPNGLFRLVVPDLEVLAKEYVDSADTMASHRFMEASKLGRKHRRRDLIGMVYTYFKSEHLWMWDFKALRHELQAAGFRDVRRAAMGDSEDAMFAAVEEPRRFGERNLAIECRK